jgi:ABC-type transporter Mla maintaining outer membrane lipid asymmetry ATPase subunit MlaF
VTKRYGENTILNELDLHIPAGQFVAVVGAAAAAKVPCCACWPGWKPNGGDCWQERRRWRIFRTIPA